jgi:hypothetical protein
MKKIFTLLLLIPFISNAQLMIEEFNYSTGQLTSAASGANVSGGNWVSFSGTGNYIPVVAGSLSYAGYGSSGVGNKIQVVYSTSSSEDVRRSFTAITSGTVYFSFLINVANTTGLGPNSGTGDYFMSFRNEAGTGSQGFKGLLLIRQGTTAGTFQLGVDPSTAAGATPVFASADLAINTTQLVVMKYEIVAGAGNDIISLFVNPSLAGTEPAPSATVTANATDTEPGQIDGIAIRQNNNSGVGTPNADLDGFRVSQGWYNAPLPLTLLAFNGTLNNEVVNLSWSTTNEVNVSSFSIERSVNGKEFSAIGKLAAKGSITSNEYNFTDEKAVAGVSYYRLKMVDNDGAYKYSQVITIKGKTIGVSIYPNPVRSDITVQHEAALKGASVSVLDLSGKQVLKVNVQAGAVQTSLDAAKLAPGTYMIVYNNDGVRLSKQFVKQ